MALWAQTLLAPAAGTPTASADPLPAATRVVGLGQLPSPARPCVVATTLVWLRSGTRQGGGVGIGHGVPVQTVERVIIFERCHAPQHRQRLRCRSSDCHDSRCRSPSHPDTARLCSCGACCGIGRRSTPARASEQHLYAMLLACWQHIGRQLLSMRLDGLVCTASILSVSRLSPSAL